VTSQKETTSIWMGTANCNEKRVSRKKDTRVVMNLSHKISFVAIFVDNLSDPLSGLIRNTDGIKVRHVPFIFSVLFHVIIQPACC